MGLDVGAVAISGHKLIDSFTCISLVERMDELVGEWRLQEEKRPGIHGRLHKISLLCFPRPWTAQKLQQITQILTQICWVSTPLLSDGQNL